MEITMFPIKPTTLNILRWNNCCWATEELLRGDAARQRGIGSGENLCFRQPEQLPACGSDELYLTYDYAAGIQYSGNRVTDINRANLKAGLDRTPDGYVWHHTEDGKMQLVNETVHNLFPHTGGFALYK